MSTVKAFLLCGYFPTIYCVGEISSLLNSDNKTIQRNSMTTVYKHYIEMLEKKESESRDAPSDELISNLRKMKDEISKGGIFQTLLVRNLASFNGKMMNVMCQTETFRDETRMV